MDYHGNSKKEKTNADKPEKKIDKVVTGEVVQKPKGIGKKFKDTFFSGDAQQVGRYVAADVLLPALRNLLVDMITRGTERLVYGDSPRRRDTRVNYGAQYQVSSPNRPFDARMSPLQQPQRARAINRHEINDIVVATRSEAELVVERLGDIIDTYDVVAVGDLYDLLGLPNTHIDQKWGWTVLNNIPIRQVRQGYLIELPPLEEI